MAKYDGQIGELKNLLPNSKNILIVLAANADIDKFAAGLSLFLSFQQNGKQVSIVSSDTVRVAQAHLFGVDNIKNTFPPGAGGNLTIILEGVVDSNGNVPALEKLDWHPEGTNLNLVFHSAPGQSFKPVNITPKYGGEGFDLIFTIGAVSLNDLGNIYSQNNQVFSGYIVNIDNQATNTNFGKTNVVDGNSSSISEITEDLIQSFGIPFDSDIASNILTGIFNATSNLSNEKVGADTYLAVAQCLRVGGRKPAFNKASAGEASENSGQLQNQAAPKPSGLDLSSLFPKPASENTYTQTQDFTNQKSNPIPSAEERPQMEGLNSADSIEIEPGWLTPKVFKGSSS